MTNLMNEGAIFEMLLKESMVAWRLSVGIAALMLLQSLVGLVFPILYRDVEWVKAA